MKLQKMEVGAHQLRQYTFRINEKEIEALLASLEIARGVVPKGAVTPMLRDLNSKITNAKKELGKALKEADVQI